MVPEYREYLKCIRTPDGLTPLHKRYIYIHGQDWYIIGLFDRFETHENLLFTARILDVVSPGAKVSVGKKISFGCRKSFLQPTWYLYFLSDMLESFKKHIQTHPRPKGLHYDNESLSEAYLIDLLKTNHNFRVIGYHRSDG